MSRNKERTTEEQATYQHIRQALNDYVMQEHGYYHLKPGETKSRWIAVMPYMPELVEKLLKKVTHILNIETKSKKPVFMVHVITDIAYYLSEYAVKNPESINRNQTAKALKQKLMTENAVLQGKFKVSPQEKHERKIEAAKKARQVHSQVNGLFREMQDDFRHHWCR